MTKSRDLGNLAQTVAVNLPTALGTAGQSLVVNSGADGLEFGAASGGGVTVYTGLSGTDGTPAGATYLLNASSPSAGDLAYVSSNTSLYQNNGNGWYRIATINTTPRIDSVEDASSNTTPFTLTGGTNTVITITATDDDQGTDLTYTHSVTAGSLNGTTVTQGTGANENVFTIAPHSSNATTFSITFTVSDDINAATSVAEFTLEFVVADSHFTSLLMATDGSAGDNNDITDTPASGNTAKTPTVVGDIYAGTFSPYRHGGYSTYFDGSGDYIRYTDASLAEGTDDFTVEFWLKRDGDQNLNDTIVGHDTTPGYQICFNTSNNIQFMYNAGDASRSLSTGTLNEGQWYHVVYQRDNGTLQGFLDGVSLGTTSVTDNFTNTIIEIGVNRGGTAYFKGHVRDVRIIKGTAFYSSSGFNVPTEPLAAVSGTGYSTTLLSCHLPYFADGGANSLTPTINGDPETKPFGPYDYDEYDESSNGGSLYFDGSDYLSLGTDSDFLIGSNDYSIEAWVYFTSASFPQGWVNHQNSTTTASAGQLIAYFYTNNSIRITDHTANRPEVVCTLPETLVANTWYHVSINRYDSNTSFKVYLNGVEATNYTTSNGDGRFTNYSTQGTVTVGVNATPIWFTGYMADFRWLVGSSAYTTDGTPPTSPLSAITNTKLLLKGTDAHVLDKSQVSNLKLVGNTAASTTQAKFSNTASVYFDGNGDYLSVSDLGLSGDITIEGWVYQSVAQSATFRCLVGASTYAVGVPLRIYTNGSNFVVYLSSTGGPHISGSFTANTWHHVALVRSSGTWTLYIDGTSAGTSTTGGTYDFASTVDWTIGADAATTYPFTGYAQDVRISNGKARYTSNFTVPSSPLKG